MTHFRSIILFGCGLLISSLSGAEIYQWVNGKGKVHYGDCPPS
jgi:hypothetical protein